MVVNPAGAACGVEVAERLGIPALWAIHESYAPHQFLLAAYGPGGAHPSAQARLEHALASASASPDAGIEESETASARSTSLASLASLSDCSSCRT